ncbi:MAG: hypothetical protein SPJ07_01605 [Bacilli bacterium]|nr:hypothetical protein [Clostridium sp.]MDY5996041.1 hypothetical protein [Bacilli bacterium]
MGIFDKIKEKNKIKKIKEFEAAYDKIILSIDNGEVHSSERFKILSQFEANLNNLNNELQDNSSLLEQVAIIGMEIRNKIENAFKLQLNREYQAIMDKRNNDLKRMGDGYNKYMNFMESVNQRLDNLPGKRKASNIVGEEAQKYGYTYRPNNDSSSNQSTKGHRR